MLHYYIDDYFNKAKCINCDFNWFIIYHYYKLVYNNKNQIIAVNFQLIGIGNPITILKNTFFDQYVGISSDNKSI